MSTRVVFGEMGGPTSRYEALVIALWSMGTCPCGKGPNLVDGMFREMMLCSPVLLGSLLELDAFFVDAATGDPLDPRA